MLGSSRKTPAQLQALECVQAWTRDRFALDADAVVVATELACKVPGCPPVETVVAFWSAPDRRHHFRIFKPVLDVSPDDLPFAWMRDALIDLGGFGCDCC